MLALPGRMLVCYFTYCLETFNYYVLKHFITCDILNYCFFVFLFIDFES